MKRLFVADALWLFYFERMGIFRILGVILDDMALKGHIPISNGSLPTGAGGVDPYVVAIILEVMVRQMKTGLASSVRDRDSAYRRTLGWTSEQGRGLGVDAEVNSGFNRLFHRFLFYALEYYKDKRLAVAIQGAAAIPMPSVATTVTIAETLSLLKKSFEPFHYGRTYFNTLNGIVWTIAAMAMIKELRDALGIPRVFQEPCEYLTAAYDLLVLGQKPQPAAEANRFTLHRQCAFYGRTVLLRVQVLRNDVQANSELEKWLNDAEPYVEGYRTSYRALTGVDVGASASPTIEQAV